MLVGEREAIWVEVDKVGAVCRCPLSWSDANVCRRAAFNVGVGGGDKIAHDHDVTMRATRARGKEKRSQNNLSLNLVVSLIESLNFYSNHQDTPPLAPKSIPTRKRVSFCVFKALSSQLQTPAATVQLTLLLLLAH